MVDDVAWSVQTEEMDEEERPFYKYTHLLFFTSCYKTSSRPPPAVASSCLPSSESLLGFNAMFRNFEEELYLQHSQHRFTYPTGRKDRFVVEESTESGGGKRKRNGKKKSQQDFEQCLEYRLVMVVPFSLVKRITREMDQIIPPANATSQ
eukprot:GHVS01064062.1.p2 GENE.GHVS01064062.1~~GHVS01064062.1.p2  ORF type:complete len:150 (-),score=26.55 GHVS01064062.1:99-548(-)